MMLLFAVLGLLIAYAAWILRGRFSAKRIDPRGKSVLVTGAASGIGRATTESLLSAGSYVYATDLSLAALQEAFPDHATTFKDRLYLAAIDVTKQDDVDRIGKAITDAGRGLYAVVNSAGVAHAPGIDSLIIKSAAELDVDKEVFPVLNINVLGTLRVNKAVYPLLFESKGVIVNISSIAGRLALVGLSPYTMSKHAVSAYSASLRREHSPVRVVCVEPGFASTPMVDKQRAYLDASKADYSKTLLKKRGDEGSWEAMKKMTLQKPSDVASEVLQGLFLNPAPAPHILVDKPINKYAYLIISSLPYRLQDILLPNLG